MRLRRSDCSAEGISRRRRGRGFSYADASGAPVEDPVMLDRIKALAIPPAWADVWICPQADGHIQATGVDAAGRKQYLYHAAWQDRAASRKFDEMLEFAARLPRLRRRVKRDIAKEGMPAERVLAAAIRMMDLGFFRIGSEQYAEENDTYGAATILRDHVTLEGKTGLRFRYPAKGAQERDQLIRDRGLRSVAEPLLRRRTGPDDFLVFKRRGRWVDVRSDDINEYIREITEGRYSAKDFRTWNGTVIAAVSLSSGPMPDSKRGTERAIREAIGQVAERLGNTPAVSRASYVDPRVIDCFRDGDRIELPPLRGAVSERNRLLIERRVRHLIARSVD